MTAALLPNGKQQYFTTAGLPAVGYKVATFDAGTSNPRVTWQDALKVAQNINPIILDGRGEASIFWEGAYKVQLQDSTGAVIWTQDNLQSQPNGFTAALVPAVTNTTDLGTAILSWRNGYFGTNVLIGPNAIPAFDPISGNIGYYARTAAEIAAGVVPTNFAYPVTPFLHLWRYMSAAQITSILGNGLTDTTSGFTAAVSVMTQMNGATLIIPTGNYSNNATVTLANFGKIIGMGTRRGAGTPPSTGKGTSINATFAGPIFKVTNGVLTAVDVLIEGINFQGNQGTYGAGDGIDVVLSAGVTIRDCVVSNFGTYNISLTGAGAYNLFCEHVYSSLAGNANFFIDGSESGLTDCRSDGGQYSVYTTGNASNFTINGGDHYEGATNTGLKLQGTRTRIQNALVRITVNNAVGIYIGNSEIGISNCESSGTGSTTGNLALDVPAGATAYRITGSRFGSQNAGADVCRLAEGGNFQGNIVECASPTGTGLELINPPNNPGVIDGNTIYGGTNSILHTSGNGRWKIGCNRLDSAVSPGTFLPMTVTAGFTLYGDYYDGSPPSVASVAALSLPQTGATTFSITGVTGITSINASGFTGKTVVLVFTGILTVTNGANLKLTGNFTTAAGSALTLACDGTNFYEVGRKA